VIYSEVVTRLHPQAAAVLAARKKVPLSDGTVRAARQALVLSTPADEGEPTPVATVTDVDVDGVRCRLYHPTLQISRAVVVYLHGGGWVIGDTTTVDGLCRRMAVKAGCAVLSVNYRLAPEHQWPAAVDDVDTVVNWLHGPGAQAAGLDPLGIALAGDSAGGHLATVAARHARDTGKPVDLQVLVYPVLDPWMSSRSYAELDGLALDRDEMAFFWNAFVPDEACRSHPDVDPFQADLAGLPPTLVLTAEFDVLRDEAENYAAALTAAGVACVHVRYQGMVHGFFRRLAKYDSAGVAVDQVAAMVRSVLEAKTGRSD